jgi:eukaryotic-like serine/threonine-protein kinase
MANRPPNLATDPTIAPTLAPPVVPEVISDTLALARPVLAAPSGPGALRPGTVVAETYQITRLLGQGGMGAVWEARHLRLPDKRVVIKVLLLGTTDPVALARFRREAEIASRLGHPNIVQVLDFNALPDGAPYIVLELLQGETLAARLFRALPTFDQTMAIVAQIGSALAAAHREGIVHRDLKPDNIFLCPTDPDGEVRDVVKILDFGISKIRGAKTVLTQDAALIGTPQYMAPEQATGRNEQIDARTDIFAFGAIVFEMLAGRPPFLGDTLASVIHAVVYAPTPSLRELAPATPAAIVAAIERALAKDRDERFADVGAFVKAVTARSLDTVPPPPAPASQPRPASSPMAPPVATERVQRGRSFPIVGALVAVALVAGAALWFLSPRRSPSPAPPRAETVGSQPKSPPATALAEAKPAPAAPPGPTTQAQAEGETEQVPKGTRPAPSGGGGAAKQETLTPAAASDLAQAEAALEAGQGAEAIRLAQHSLYAQKSSRAYEIIVRAHCVQGDLGNAKAALPHVAGHDRAAVLRACGKLGVDLR